MHKGTIVLVPFPFTDLSGQKVRPALVLYGAKRGEDCIVAFVSSRTDKRVQPFNVPAAPSGKNGLKIDSVIKIDKIATLHTKIVLGELGTLESAILATVDSQLKKLFGL